MTKHEKIERMLAASMTTSDGILAALRSEQPVIAKLIDAKPDLVKEWQASVIRVTAPFFEPMTEPEIDAAIVFFTSPAGVAYRAAGVSALPKAGPLIQKATQDFLLKLATGIKS